MRLHAYSVTGKAGRINASAFPRSSAVGRTRRLGGVAFGLALALLARASPALASSGQWVQSDWSGGASALTALDPGDRTGWTLYESKSDTVTWAAYASSGALKLQFSTIVWPTSDDSAGQTGFKFLGNASPPTQYSSSLRIQGSGEAAHLRLQTADPVWTSSPTLGSLPGMFDVKAAAGDLDGDGDQDLMVGANDGITYGWKNIGYSTSPIWAYWPAWNAPDVGSFARPELVDLDGDGLLDLVIGSAGGITSAYRNTGSAAGPAWTVAADWSTGDNWATMAPSGYGTNYGSALVQGTGDYIFAFPTTGNVFLRYSIANNSWATMAAPGYATAAGGALAQGTSDYIYAFPGNQNILQRYSITDNSWATMAVPGYTIGDGSVLVQGTSDYLYAFVGSSQNIFRRYSIADDSWATMAAPGYGISAGGSLVQGTSDYIYAFPGGNQNVLRRYSIANDSWATMAAPGYGINRGGTLGKGTSDYIYAFVGNGQNVFRRYSITDDSWAAMTASGYGNFQGAGLTSSQTVSAVIYSFPGAGGGAGQFLRYNPTTATNLPSVPYGSPAFADLDADGDKDLFMGAQDGFTYAYENQGTAASPGPWVRKTSWETAGTGIPDVGDYSSPVFSDLDGDGDQDLIVMRRTVNSQPPSGYAYRNDGTTLNPSWTYQSSWNPPIPGGSNWAYFTPALADLDGDGKKDILIGAGSNNANVSDTIYAYKNTGVGGPSWSAVQSGWGLNSPAGMHAYNTRYVGPQLADIDNDGDLDLMVGVSFGVGTAYGTMFGYRNMGTSTSPVLAYWPSWNFNRNVSYTGFTSAFADLNGDGKKDMMVGTDGGGCGGGSLGYVLGYSNIGVSSAPSWSYQSGWNMPGSLSPSTCGADPGPALGDLDGDGLLDLIVGYVDGNAYAYRNTGGAASPVFTSSPTLAAGLPDIGSNAKYALADLDDDGDLDLMIGEINGAVYGYKNVGTAAQPSFGAQASWNSADVGSSAFPAIGDLDGDGKYDLLVGAQSDGVYSYRNTSGFLTTGDYISAVYDTGGSFDYSQVSWTGDTPAGGAVTVQVRAGATPIPPDGTWTSWTTFANGQDLGAAMDNKRYVQWKANMTTADVSTSPVINDLTIEYLGYDSAPREVVSSKYDTGLAANAVRKLEWSGLPLPAGATVWFQVRTSPDNVSWTVWLGSDSLSSSYVTAGGTVPYAARDGLGDRWFQVKAFLSGSGTNTPEVSYSSATFGALGTPALGALTADSSTQITLDFTDNSDDEDTFRVTAATYAGANNDLASIPTADKPGTGVGQAGAVSALTPNTSYYIRLRANENDGRSYSPFSNEIATFTHAAPPADQGTAYDAYIGSLTVRWGSNNNPLGGRTSYYAERATDSDFTLGLADSGWINTTYYSFASLSLGTTYYFRVKARNDYLVETSTTGLHAAQPCAPPATAEPVAVSSDTLTPGWGKNGNNADAYYYAQRSLFSDFSASNDYSGWLRDSSQFQFTGLAINTTYYFRVKARNLAGDETLWTVLPATMTMAAYPGYSAATVYSSSITWNWTSGGNPGGTTYVIESSTDPAFSVFAGSGATTSTSYTFQGLSPVVRHYGRVKARNGRGAMTPPTDLGNFVTKPARPGAGSPVFTNITNTQVLVNWTNGGNPTGVEYYVEKASDSAFSLDVFSPGWLADFTYAFTGLSPTTAYYFRVKARETADPANESIGWTALGSTSTTPNPPLPGAVAILSSVSIRTSWTANGNPAGTQFMAERATDAGFGSGYAATAWTADMLSYDFTGLVPNTYYYFRAKARNASLTESPPANLANARTFAAAPMSPSVSNVTGSSVRLDWSINNNPSGTEYWSEVATSSDPWTTYSTGGWITSSYFNFTGLSEDTTYWLRAKARNGDYVETSWSAVASTKTVFPPAAPTALEAGLDGVGALQADRIYLRWTDNSATETEFRVEDSADGSSFFPLVSVGADTTFYMDTGLEGAQRMWYRVKAWSPGGGDSAYSNQASTWTNPALPVPLAFTDVQAQSLRANWGAGGNSGQALYNCELSTMASFVPLLASSQTYNAWAQFPGLDANATHYARVRAQSGAGRVSSPDTGLGSTVTARFLFTASLYDYPPPSWALQGQKAAYARLVLEPNGADALWTGLEVSRAGSGDDQDVYEVALRKDTNQTGTFEDGTDQQAAPPVYGLSSGKAALSLSPAYRTLSGPTTYFVVVKPADDYLSWPGNSLGVSLSSLSFTSPNAAFNVSPGSFSSALSTITKLADTLTVAGAGAAPWPNVSRGTYNNAFLKLTMYAGRDRAYLRKLHVRKLGSLAEAYVSAVKLYKDANASGAFEPAADALVSSALDVFINGVTTATFTSPSTHTVTTSQSVYFVVLDVASNAPLGETLGVRVDDASSVILMDETPDAVSLAGPLDSGLPTVADPPNTLYVLAADSAPASIQQGSQAVFETMRLWTDSGQSLWTQLKVSRSAGSLDSDYQAMKLYADRDLDGLFGPGDEPPLAQSALSGGTAVLDISETVTASTKTYYVVPLISGSANTTSQAGAEVQSGWMAVGSAQTSVTGLPFASSLSQITATVDLVEVVPDGAIAPFAAKQGETAVPMLKLSVRALSNAAKLGSLSIGQTGTAADSDIAAVRIYKDDDGDGVFQSTNQVVSGSYAFSASTANVAFSSIQDVSVSTQVYFLAVDVAAGAVPGRDVKLRLLDAAAVGVLAPDAASSTFPIVSNSVTLEKLTAAVVVSTQSLAPASAQAGAQDVILERFSLRTDQSYATVSSMTLSRLGGQDSDSGLVRLYWDADGDGTPDANEAVGSGSFAAGALILGVANAQARNVTTSLKDYFLSMDVPSGAQVGVSLAVSVISLEVAVPDGVQGGVLPFASNPMSVAEPAAELRASFEDKMPASLTQGDSGVLVASFTVSASCYTVSWTGLSALKQGTIANSGISLLRLYKDDGNGAWGGAAEETSLASAGFSAGQASLAFSTQTVTVSSAVYYLAVDVAPGAAAGSTFGLEIPAATYLGVLSPDLVSGAPFPWAGALGTVSATADTMTVTWTSLAPAAGQGDLKALGRLVVSADANTVEVSALRVQKAGTALDSDVSALRLYRDANSDGIFQETDALLAAAAGLSAGFADLAPSVPASVGTSAQTWFLVAGFSPTASVGATFGLAFTSASFTVSTPDAVVLGVSPSVCSITGTIADSSDTVRLAFTDLAPASLYQGSAANAAARLSLLTLGDRAVWTGIKANLTGSAALSDVGEFRVYEDSDLDGVLVSTSDVMVGSGTFSTGLIDLTLGRAETLTETARDFFLTLDVAAGAVVGRTMGLSLANEAYITVAGPDGVEAFAALATSTGAVRDPAVPAPLVVRILKGDGTANAGDPAYTPYLTRVVFSWERQSLGGAVEEAQWCVGASPCAAASTWTAASGTGEEARALGLSLDGGSTYYLSVRGRNGAVYGDPASARFVPDSVMPYVPGAPTFTKAGDSVIVGWAQAALGPSGLGHYVLEERPGTTPVWVEAATTTARAMTVTLGGVGTLDLERAAGTYFYRVKAVNGAGVAGDPGPVGTLQFSLETLPDISEVSAYPGPFDSRVQDATINFTLKAAASVRVEIRDIFGRLVRTIEVAGTAGANDAAWDGKDASGAKVRKGIYMVTVKAGSSKETFKIGVIH